MRRIAVITTSRADYGIYRPLLRRLADDDGLALLLIAGGTHLSAAFGHTADEIAGDGFAIAARVEALPETDTPAGVALAMGRAAVGFAEAYAATRPDLIVVLGDRFEMHAAASAAQPLGVPLAHIHGGELTLGAMDDALRHSITKMSHLHFPATETYARRIRQMGEEDWRVAVTGALSLDNLDTVTPLDDAALSARIGLPLDPAPVLATFHPATREDEAVYGPPETQARALFEALDGCGRPVVFTAPNADPGGRALRALIDAYVDGRDDAVCVESLGTAGYFALMARAAAMLGNSSSGILEAASFALPVVNVGSRQEGRDRAENVVDAAPTAEALAAALGKALDPAFRADLAGMANPYRGAGAAAAIHDRLKKVALDARLVKKRFVDRTMSEETGA